MDFESKAQQEVYERIEPWMKELFGIFLKKRDDAPGFGVKIGSAFVHISVNAWGKNDATITSRAYVVVKAPMAPDLLEFLLRENDTARFGAFGLDKEQDIFFEHTIVGSTCVVDDIKNSVLAVGYTVDQYDDKIIARWGGMRATGDENEF